MGRIISQKNKSKVIRAFRAPSAPVVMSLMALILVCAAPALVSVIDDSYTYEGSSETQLLDLENATGLIRKSMSESLDSSYIPASQNDGTFVIALNDSALVEDVSYAVFNDIDLEPMKSGNGSVKVVTSSDVTQVKVVMGSVIHLIRSESDPSVWTGSFSSVDLVQLRAGEYDQIRVMMYGSNELFEMEIFAVGEYVIPYGEIIIGATGALLIVCAILATPWVGTTGLTVKRRRSA